MKQVIILLTIIALATPAMAWKECTPHIEKYWRTANGGNTIKVGWRCKGSGNSMDVTSNNICGITENGKTACVTGFKRLSIKGGSTKHDFERSEYPIKRLFLKK